MISYLKIIKVFSLLVFLFGVFLVIQSCDKSADEIRPEAPGISPTGKKPPKDPPPPPPPPPPPYYFVNCNNPEMTGYFVAGVPASVTINLHYVNSPGGNYPAYTSQTVNGIHLSTPAGTLNVGSGSILFTAHGTPTNVGFFMISVQILNSSWCNLTLTAQNPPVQGGNCSDPGPAIGSTGCVTFIYRGEEVTYATVRAADGKIWTQQNLGSPSVAFDLHDTGSYGHYFQWGRWDDGHQIPTGPSVTGSSSLQNPSHIPNGNVNFIKGSSNSTAWWGIGAATDTWSSSPPSATNGLDPGAALGAGWHMPTAEEWNMMMEYEGIYNETTAFMSNLKLTESGYRNSVDAVYYPQWTGGNYWSSSTAGSNTAKYFKFDDSYDIGIKELSRGYGMNVRFVKN